MLKYRTTEITKKNKQTREREEEEDKVHKRYRPDHMTSVTRAREDGSQELRMLNKNKQDRERRQAGQEQEDKVN